MIEESGDKPGFTLCLALVSTVARGPGTECRLRVARCGLGIFWKWGGLDLGEDGV